VVIEFNAIGVRSRNCDRRTTSTSNVTGKIGIGRYGWAMGRSGTDNQIYALFKADTHGRYAILLAFCIDVGLDLALAFACWFINVRSNARRIVKIYGEQGVLLCIIAGSVKERNTGNDDPIRIGFRDRYAALLLKCDGILAGSSYQPRFSSRLCVCYCLV
jgi:hypothetical protein